jgi:hypothetical protein
VTRGRAAVRNEERHVLPCELPVETEPAVELIAFLEPDQLVSDTSQPVPLADLTAPVRAALWALRVFTLLVAAAVVFTFISQLAQ